MVGLRTGTSSLHPHYAQDSYQPHPVRVMEVGRVERTRAWQVSGVDYEVVEYGVGIVWVTV